MADTQRAPVQVRHTDGLVVITTTLDATDEQWDEAVAGQVTDRTVTDFDIEITRDSIVYTLYLAGDDDADTA